MSTTHADWPGLDCERRSLIRDGLVLRYHHTTPAPHKLWLVVALPFGIPVSVLAPALAALRPAFNVITWESRYLFDLDVPFTGEEALAPDDHVDDMLAVLAALQVDRCRLIGYCSGAGFALLAATRRPDCFRDVVLVSGEFQLFRRGHAATAYQHSIDGFLPVVAQSRETAAAIFTTMAEVSAAAADEETQLQRQMNAPFTSEERLFRYACSYMAYRDFDALTLARQVTQPTLVIGGGCDEHTRPENAHAIADALPRATLHVDEHADHYAFCTPDSPVLDAIMRHLGH